VASNGKRRRVARHIREATTVELAATDAAVVVSADEGLTVYIPDGPDDQPYPEHVFSVLAFLVALEDDELRALMRQKLQAQLADAAEDMS